MPYRALGKSQEEERGALSIAKLCPLHQSRLNGMRTCVKIGIEIEIEIEIEIRIEIGIGSNE